MALSPAPVPVVLPLLGDPVALLDAVSVLAARWPQDVDASLVVPAGPLTPRDRGLLTSLGEDVRVVELSGPAPTFGALVAAVGGDVPLVVLDPQALPDAETLHALAAGRSCSAGLVVDPSAFAVAPVLTAARDLPSLAALLTLLDPPAETGHDDAGEAQEPRSAHDVAVRPGTVSVVLVVREQTARAKACLAALRRSSRGACEIVVVTCGPARGAAWPPAARDLVLVEGTGADGYAAACNRGIAASHGETVVLLDAAAVVPRFWSEGLVRVLQAHPRAGAVGPRSNSVSGHQLVPSADYTDLDAFRPWADAWRREHAGQHEEVGRLAGGCLALRREALLEVGGLDEAFSGSVLAVQDLLDRLRRGGFTLHVAHEVLVHHDVAPAPAPEPDAVHARGKRRRRGEPVLSAALIVKDEQAALPACLAALRGVVDEVVVCDTGSSDRTVEIAQAFGARVVHAPWTGDFAAARNTVLEQCRGLWILSVDADEQLRQQPGTDLALFALASDSEAVSLRVLSRADQAGEASFEHAAGRLFLREQLRWVGAVHETLVSTVTGALPAYARCASAWLDHDGYLTHVYQGRDKESRNLQLAEKDHRQALASADADRLWKTSYELARALSKVDGEQDRVESLLLAALQHMPVGLVHLHCDARVRLATAHVRQGRLESAESAARAALACSPADPAALLVLAQLLSGTARPQEALDVLDQRASTTSGGAVRDLGKEAVDLPLLRARLLHRLSRTAEATAVLLDLADTHLGALDWPLLHDCLRDHVAGTDVLAAVAARSPEDALAALDGLEEADREALHAALAERGVDARALTPDALRRARLDAALLGHDAELVAQAALALEEEDLQSALDLWSRVPGSEPVRAARARCLLQLGRLDDAVAAVEGIDVDALPVVDLLAVVAVAAAAGDPGTAQALLERADRSAPAEMGQTLTDLARTLGLALPDRVDQAP